MNKEEAMKILKDFHDKSALFSVRTALDTIFPELCESEDEKIRKEIISFIQDHIDEINLQVSGDYDTRDKEDIALQEWCKKAIAWLEKQKEYESTDFEYVCDRTDCGDLTSALDKYSEEAIINMCHAWYDKGIELERKSWLEKQCYTKKDVDDAYLKGICYTKHELEKQGEKTADKIEPFDKYDGLTDFERTLADICIGWIGEELGWQQYIKDNADVLLKIAIKKFNSVQDTLFKQKPAWSEEDEKNLQGIIDEIQANKSSAPSYDINVYDRFLSWLKQLKQRVGG